MKVDTMRKIDYYAGVPLCFVLTLWFGLVHVFSPAKRKTPRKVLLIELSEMGSAILVDPAMCKLQQHGAELYFLIFKKNAASLRLLGTVAEKNVFTIREDGLVPLATDTLRFLFWARRQGIDSVIDLELFSRFTALLTGLSGATNRVGFYAFHNEGLYRGELLTHRVAYNAHVHISKTFIALVNALLSKKDEHPYSKTLVSDDEIRLTKAEISATQQDAMRELVNRDYPGYTPNQHRIVLINPNASELLPQRRWMPERYVAVMQKILNNYLDVIILITGAPAERQEAEELKQQVNNERCVNFAGRLRLAELPVLYSIASLMLTNDSGPGHFSSITDLPTFVIFGPETPKLYGSLGNSTPIYAGLACSPCVSAANHRKTPCTDNVCLQVIEADEVYEKLKTVFDAGS